VVEEQERTKNVGERRQEKKKKKEKEKEKEKVVKASKNTFNAARS